VPEKNTGCKIPNQHKNHNFIFHQKQTDLCFPRSWLNEGGVYNEVTCTGSHSRRQHLTVFCIAEHWSWRVFLWCFDLLTLGSGGKESCNDKLLSMPRELSSFSWQGFLNNEWQLPRIVTQQKCDLLAPIAEPPPDQSPLYSRRLNLTGTGVTVLGTDMAL